MITFAAVEKLASAHPGVERGTSYGTPALKVRGKLMARLKEDDETLVLRVEWTERERVLAVAPEVFFLTDHYRHHPWVLVRLASVSVAQLKLSLAHAWTQTAPRSLLAKVAGTSSAA